LIGTGFEFEKMKQIAKDNRLDNVKFLGWMDADQLPSEIAGFDVCLGIFGDTIKAQLVIPNKIFHYAAMAKPIITMDTPAIKELFTDQKDIALIEPKVNNLSQEILRLKDSLAIRNELAQNARNLVETTCDASHIAVQLVEIIKTVL
jgi:glycosyltransferase involved in cell wall biosynthesis